MKKNLLKLFKILYVEDDNSIRTELGSLLENFFDKVYTASNGLEGLEVFKENQQKIDIILTDINMPKMGGIEMVKKIREIDANIPIIFATAYSDTEFLFEAVKLHVHDYIVKPIDIRQTLVMMSDLVSNLYQEFLIKQQNRELEQYQEVINQNNLVVKTDLEQNITYVNEQFCNTTGFDKEELIGKPFSYLAHSDTNISQIDDMFEALLQDRVWHGKIKNQTKFGGYYIVDSYCITLLDEVGSAIGYMCIFKDITLEVNQTRLLKKALIKDKSEIILKEKANKVELNSKINELYEYIKQLQKLLRVSELEKERSNYNIEKLTSENIRVNNELSMMAKNSAMTQQRTTTAFKMSKYNVDLRVELKKLLKEKEDLEYKLTQIKSVLELRIKELEEDNKKYLTQIEEYEDTEILLQKVEHWKDKSKECFRRIEQLEQELLRIADADTINRLFK